MSKIKKWQILSEDDVSPSKWFRLFRHSVKLPNGNVYDDFYVSDLGDVAMVLPVTSNNELIFVRQYKHGAREITLELPAGRIEKGQSPIQAARLELEQETGIVSDDLTPIGELRPFPSKDKMIVYGFLANGINCTRKQNLDETEDLEVEPISLTCVDEKIRSGEINCSDTLALIALAKLKGKI